MIWYIINLQNTKYRQERRPSPVDLYTACSKKSQSFAGTIIWYRCIRIEFKKQKITILKFSRFCLKLFVWNECPSFYTCRCELYFKLKVVFFLTIFGSHWNFLNQYSCVLLLSSAWCTVCNPIFGHSDSKYVWIYYY